MFFNRTKGGVNVIPECTDQLAIISLVQCESHSIFKCCLVYRTRGADKSGWQMYIDGNDLMAHKISFLG